ncbi:DUF4192 domain-containing protein [Saccharomonospora azurea]|uniref:DUF4192 domain-containing protein n=1 Tax=Saccharomonospora azurea NA-128 TaxID=882081 RepID=H8G7Z6_9PSEU|nr:DUF4192 domain-containing protein [Saccharomonospora azurea]EHK83566.1 hypothetical protein SZMC14600_19109 [Saccharomonospora azurea SZMC 14600]EHY88393.1 hypothetical protein SacazDRAFT_01463 [Saccharomonospora azurea NA-128]
MTPSSTTDSQTADRSPIDLRDPGELLAATPHLLGFDPVDSLVLVGHRGTTGARIGNIVRADLPQPGDEAALARQLLGPLAHDSVAVTAVVVGGRRGDATGPPARTVVTAVREVFGQAGLPVSHALWVPKIRAGAPWRCYEQSCCAGHLPDPASTVMAAVSAHAGLVTHSSRAAMERQLQPVASDVLERRAAMLRRRLSAASRDDVASLRRGRAAVRTVLARAWKGTLLLSDTEVVELAVALAQPRIRDACLATALPADSAGAVTAERLWLLLTKHTPTPERAQPATLLAYSAYVRGEGALAGMALDAAQAADPNHLLSKLLRQALGHGLPPEKLVGLATSCDEEPIWTAPEDRTPPSPCSPHDSARPSTGPPAGDG